MPIKITSTKDVGITQGVKILVYGAAGAGKTTLITTIPGKPIIISAEAGLLSISHCDIPVINVSSIQDVAEAYQYLQSDEGKQYDWVAIDSISEIAEQVLANEKANTKDGRKAYGELQDQMMRLLRQFRDLEGRNVYVSSKMEQVKDEGLGMITHGPMMPGNKLGQQLPYLFDEVLCLRTQTGSDGNNYRFLQTTTDGRYTAKDRSGKLDARGEAPNIQNIYQKITGQGEQ